MEYELGKAHQASVKHHAAEALCELPTTGVDNTKFEDEIAVMVVNQTKNNDQKNVIVPDRAKRDTRLPKEPDDHNVKPPTMSELIKAQSENLLCEQSRQLSELSASGLTLDKNRVLVKQAHIDGSLQELVSSP